MERPFGRALVDGLVHRFSGDFHQAGKLQKFLQHRGVDVSHWRRKPPADTFAQFVGLVPATRASASRRNRAHRMRNTPTVLDHSAGPALRWRGSDRIALAILLTVLDPGRAIAGARAAPPLSRRLGIFRFVEDGLRGVGRNAGQNSEIVERVHHRDVRGASAGGMNSFTDSKGRQEVGRRLVQKLATVPAPELPGYATPTRDRIRRARSGFLVRSPRRCPRS